MERERLAAPNILVFLSPSTRWRWQEPAEAGGGNRRTGNHGVWAVGFWGPRPSPPRRCLLLAECFPRVFEPFHPLALARASRSRGRQSADGESRCLGSRVLGAPPFTASTVPSTRRTGYSPGTVSFSSLYLLAYSQVFPLNSSLSFLFHPTCRHSPAGGVVLAVPCLAYTGRLV